MCSTAIGSGSMDVHDQPADLTVLGKTPNPEPISSKLGIFEFSQKESAKVFTALNLPALSEDSCVGK